jgi:ribosomal protein S18 acetylase RimI-like enzyme
MPIDRNPLIREVRPDEYEALGALTVAAYRLLEDPDRHRFPDEYAAYFAELADVNRRAAVCPVLVAVGDGGRVLGGVTYVPGPGTPLSESERENEAGFRMLAVSPEAQGRGVGRALVRACIARARSDDRRRMVLLTRPFMHRAHELYERLGFRRAPERDWEAMPGFHLLGYELDLDDAGNARSPGV